MEKDLNQQPMMANLCKNNCGFYGSPATDNFCSKCFKILSRTQASNQQPLHSSATSGSISIEKATEPTQFVVGSPETKTISLVDSNMAQDSANESALTGNDESTSTSIVNFPTSSIASMASKSFSFIPTSTNSNSSSASSHPIDVPSSVGSANVANKSEISTCHSENVLSTTAAVPSTPCTLMEASGSASSGCGSSSFLDVSQTESSAISSPSSSLHKSSSFPSKPSTNRCHKCNKKVGLTGFDCRCGFVFCPTHRYSDMHECTFDYKTLGAQEISKNNPVIKKDKVEKI